MRPVLDSFYGIIDRYIDRYVYDSGDYFDVPYYYNERATLGVLAGAVWLHNPKNNFVLEEYSTEKQSGKGRQDIWFLIDDESSPGSHSCYAEAKQRDVKLPLNTRKSVSSFEEKLKLLGSETVAASYKANQVNKSVRSPGIAPKAVGMGILFLIPKIREKDGQTAKELKELHSSYRVELDQAIERYTRETNSPILLGSFARLDLLRPGKHYKHVFYPGVDVLLCKNDIDGS